MQETGDLKRRVVLVIVTLTPLSLFIFLIFSPTPFSLLYLFPTQTFQNPKPNIALCLVGGARRFELTGPSIINHLINNFNKHNNLHLYLHSPLDKDSWKFSLFTNLDRIKGVRVFKPTKMNETEAQLRVLTPSNSPNGIQGLLQYFNLVEGCITMIQSHQEKHNFTYDWIIRTRVDGYWSGPLGPENFVPGKYIVPPGSSYGGLNDRFGVGDLNTSIVALSRLSLIPKLDSAGFRQLNSESSFKAQLTASNITYATKRLPFCVVTDRTYEFPPGYFGVPVAAMSSKGPLSGAKCRPCKAACTGSCVAKVMNGLGREWSWTDWANGSLDLCNAQGPWEKKWEKLFDRAAGKKLAAARRAVKGLTQEQCVADFEKMRRRTSKWDAPEPSEICNAGLGTN